MTVSTRASDRAALSSAEIALLFDVEFNERILRRIFSCPTKIWMGLAIIPFADEHSDIIRNASDETENFEQNWLRGSPPRSDQKRHQDQVQHLGSPKPQADAATPTEIISSSRVACLLAFDSQIGRTTS